MAGTPLYPKLLGPQRAAVTRTSKGPEDNVQFVFQCAPTTPKFMGNPVQDFRGDKAMATSPKTPMTPVRNTQESFQGPREQGGCGSPAGLVTPRSRNRQDAFQGHREQVGAGSPAGLMTPRSTPRSACRQVAWDRGDDPEAFRFFKARASSPAGVPSGAASPRVGGGLPNHAHRDRSCSAEPGLHGRGSFAAAPLTPSQQTREEFRFHPTDMMSQNARPCVPRSVSHDSTSQSYAPRSASHDSSNVVPDWAKSTQSSRSRAATPDCHQRVAGHIDSSSFQCSLRASVGSAEAGRSPVKPVGSDTKCVSTVASSASPNGAAVIQNGSSFACTPTYTQRRAAARAAGPSRIGDSAMGGASPAGKLFKGRN